MEDLSQERALFVVAASVADRTVELIEGGWSRSSIAEMTKRAKGEPAAPQKFCVHGAMELALAETFGGEMSCGRLDVCGGFSAQRRGGDEVEAVVTGFIAAEARAQYGYDGPWTDGSMAVATWNDMPERTQEQVLDVCRAARDRLWALAQADDDMSYAEADELQVQTVHATA